MNLTDPISKLSGVGKITEGKLAKCGIETEFSDGEYLVLMATPENESSDYATLLKALSALPKKEELPREKTGIRLDLPKKMSIREAVFAPHERISVRSAIGRVCASPTVSCPPAVPIAVSGEVITEEAVLLFEKYKTYEIEVVKND